MNGVLSTTTIVAALVLAVWYLVRTALDRAPSRLDLIACVVLSVLVAVLVVVAVAGLFGGDRPADTGTFAGYLVTTIGLMPTALILAKMEPTRWGNLILGIGCLIVPVLVLRLQQIASVTGA
ncbi:hypothetical protein Aph02nite_56460 [Actinoplanes philippinensis]|uniref:Uncharacterized protein n=1 Tax=Actinoplanes philippinensis TaxID=35752 RepID=A0A1I2J182_9ACTN|nr:hypothetical protein [Actinoplanes philippinensis]GIE79696.1 hypothetical protein Aph02nite_56460 [Actinoplanes philippinensis]SFF48234.1 hypothetical protein SAMN05421541_111157 [Actinoplanes philippinensis]